MKAREPRFSLISSRITIIYRIRSLSIAGATMRRSGSSTVITNGRTGGVIGQGAARLSVASRNQLEPSPQELPVKDTDRAIDVASAECEYLINQLVFF